MYCPSCEESLSDLQTLCPRCFRELVAGGGHEHAAGSIPSVPWPDISFNEDAFKIDTGALASLIPDETYRATAADALEHGADRLAGQLPDASAREVARDKLEAAADWVEEQAGRHVPEKVARRGRERLQNTVERLADMVPEENARELARRKAREKVEAATRHLPAGNIRQDAQGWTEEQIRRAEARGQQQKEEWANRQRQQMQTSLVSPPQQQAFDPWTPTDPAQQAGSTVSAMGCFRFLAAMVSLIIPGFGQMAFGPRIGGGMLFFFWLLMMGNSQSGSLWWFLLGLASAAWTWMGRK